MQCSRPVLGCTRPERKGTTCAAHALLQVLLTIRNRFPPAQALHSAKLQEQQAAQGAAAAAAAAAAAPAAPTSQKLLQACSHMPLRRAPVLLCGREGAGQAQLGPAVLHELEGLLRMPLACPACWLMLARGEQLPLGLPGRPCHSSTASLLCFVACKGYNVCLSLCC
jgi:hypothetical protein